MQRLLLTSSVTLLTLAMLAPSAAASSHFECGTPQRLAEAKSRIGLAPIHAPRTVLPGGTPKSTRDSFGEAYNVRESENFAVKWLGSDVTEAKAAAVLTSLEASWGLFIETLNHSLPAGTDSFRFNLYIAGETDNPSIDFAGGYATVDGQGFPYMVVSKQIAMGPQLNHVVSHEFYHDVQFGAEAYFEHPWYYEATADWASQELYSSDHNPFTFIGAYAMLPELPVFSFGDPFGGDQVAGVHQYGAAIFPRFISEFVGDATTVPQSWETASAGEDPLAVLDRLTARPLLEVFGEFAAHNAIWDYAASDKILAAVNLYASAFPEHSPVAARHNPDGTSGMVRVDAARLPRAMGYNVIEARAPASGKVSVSLAVQPTGSLGTAANWSATVVSVEAGAPRYQAVAIAANMAEVELDVTPNRPFYLVVAVPSQSRSESETYSYDYAIEPLGDVEPEPEPEPTVEDGGCGCSSQGGHGGGLALAIFVALVALRPRARRRRRRRG